MPPQKRLTLLYTELRIIARGILLILCVLDKIFRKNAGLPLSSVVCCCADRKGGTTYEKYDKRAMARKHHSARGQQKQLKGDEGTARIHGKASRGLGKDLHRRAEGNIRKVPRLLG